MKTALTAFWGLVLVSSQVSSFAQTQGPLGQQSTKLVEGASCAADVIEEDELSKEAARLEAEYERERRKLQKKVSHGRGDPYKIEEALKFFAGGVFKNEFYSPLTSDKTIEQLGRVSNIENLTDEQKAKFEESKSALDASKVSFISGDLRRKDGTDVTMTKEQQDAMNAYVDRMLDVLLMNKGCDHFAFDVDSESFNEKYFSTESEAKKYVTDHEVHAERLERCEGPLERKKTNRVAAPVFESEKELDCGDLQSYFLDNQWELETDELMQANQVLYKSGTCTPLGPCSEETALRNKLEANAKANREAAWTKINECVAKLKGDSSKRIEIVGVDILSSASRFRNTGIACSMSFAELSALRARSVEELLMKGFESNGIPYRAKVSKGQSTQESESKPSYLFPVSIDSNGEWGNYIDAVTKNGGKPNPKYEKLRGSSGPAPGELENKSEYDQYKYVKIKIRYKQKDTVVPQEFKSADYQVICKSIGYTCYSNESSSSTKLKHMKNAYKARGGDSPGPQRAKKKKKKKKESIFTQCGL